MPFSVEDWLWILQLLARAQLNVRKFRDASPAEEVALSRLLEDAIRDLHAVAEYTINVQLELARYGATARPGQASCRPSRIGATQGRLLRTSPATGGVSKEGGVSGVRQEPFSAFLGHERRSL